MAARSLSRSSGHPVALAPCSPVTPMVHAATPTTQPATPGPGLPPPLASPPTPSWSPLAGAKRILAPPSAVDTGLAHRLRQAADWLRRGGVVAYPTEAVYGLGCDPWNGSAVRRILAMKRRPEAKGLILIAAELAQLAPFVQWLEPTRMAEIFATWPGPHTWLLPARPETPVWLRGQHDTLAVRVIAHPLAAALCRATGMALVSTSANRTSQTPARTALEVRLRLGATGGRVRAVPRATAADRGAYLQADYVLVGPCGGRAQCSSIRDGRTGHLLRG